MTNTIKLFCILTLLISISSKAQPNLDKILVDENKQIEVLLVGTFHFAYYDEDTYKTDPENRADILSNKRQSEIKELVNYISRFKPTKIFVEDYNKDNVLMENYRNYQEGNYKLSPDEIDQIAYRLMDRFHLDTIYGVDQRTLFYTLRNNPDTKDYTTNLHQGLDFQKDFLESEIGKKYMESYELEDKFLLKTTMLNFFKWLNSPNKQKRGFYSTFAGILGSENGNVADATTLGFLSRNIRILNHIESNTYSPNDRVLILFGSAHTDFFKLYYDSSPEHKLIEFNELENYTK